MSKIDDLKRLREEVAGGPQLVEKLAGCKSADEFAERIASIAKERGYDLDAADILAVITGRADGSELTQAELSAVSGGGGFTTTLQPTTKECPEPTKYGPPTPCS